MNENAQGEKSTLVLGGTGKTGRRVAKQLMAAGLPVRIGSRSAAPPFDWEDKATWAAALRDVESVYVTYYPDVAFPRAAESIRSLVRMGVDSGIERLVLLSGRGDERALASEHSVRESGVEWTILRASWFAQNFSEHFLLPSVRSGVIALPAGAVAEPFVDADDIAAVAVAALTRRCHAGAIYELTGPRPLTFADVADELTRVTGREVRYLPVTPAEFAAAAMEQGVPREEATLLTELFNRVLDGRNANVTDDVERVLGRRPGDFADYARAAAATGVWGVAAVSGMAR